jgi:hypothetical protein
MQLGNIVKGRIAKPVRLLMYGPVGVGKSTFAASAPSPIFIGAEDGTSELNVERFPQPQAWLEVEDAVTELLTTEHPYKTLVIDTVDWLEPMCWQHVCAHSRDKNGRPFESIRDMGYGSGYAAALDLWRILLARLEELRDKKGMSIVLLAHTQISTFKNPEGENFDRHALKLNKRTAGLVREWPDAVFFAYYETFTHTKEGETKAISSGARMLATQYTAAFDAKNRYDLPERIPLDWQSFADAIAQRPAAIQSELEAELAKSSDDIRARVRKRLESVSADDLTELKRITIHLAAMNNSQTKEVLQ